MGAQLNLFGMSDRKISFEMKAHVREVYEYALIISPDQETKSRVDLMKKTLHRDVGLSDADLWSIAHISLFRFTGKEVPEHLIIPAIKKALAAVPRFEISLADDIDVKDKGEKKSLAYKLKNAEQVEAVNAILLQSFKFRFHSLDPCLSLASQVSSESFQKIKDLQQYAIRNTFVCDKVIVLRRPLNSSSRYLVYGEVSLT